MTVVEELVERLGDKPELYHVGLVVPDIAAAVEQYQDLFGLRFASLRHTSLEVRVDGVIRTPELIVSYTMDGPPYVELIEERSGGTWAADALGLNHIGFWAKDLLAAAARLEASGLAARVRDNGPDDRPARFTYHPGLGGMWVELVAPRFALTLQDWFAASLASPAGESGLSPRSYQRLNVPQRALPRVGVMVVRLADYGRVVEGQVRHPCGEQRGGDLDTQCGRLGGIVLSHSLCIARRHVDARRMSNWSLHLWSAWLPRPLAGAGLFVEAPGLAQSAVSITVTDG
jgi:catechol 2,3-dioxygenase-like lactoylglutathione lyase family enzyme